MTDTKMICPKCGVEKLLNTDNFYVARPRVGHKSGGWQSFCKDCWKGINQQNKAKLKAHKERTWLIPTRLTAFATRLAKKVRAAIVPEKFNRPYQKGVAEGLEEAAEIIEKEDSSEQEND